METLGQMPEFLLIKISAQIDPCWLYLLAGLLILVNFYKWVVSHRAKVWFRNNSGKN